MKLLTTIAAVLISVCAYSQDLILFNNGTFSQNGEEISLEQVANMTMTYNVGKKRLAKAVKLRYASSSFEGRTQSSTNIAAGLVSIGIGFAIWQPWNPNDQYGYIANEGDFDIFGIGFFAAGCVLLATGTKNSSPLEKANELFGWVAWELNQAIIAAEQQNNR